MNHYDTPPAVEARKPWRSGHPKIRAAQERVALEAAAGRGGPPVPSEALLARLGELDEVVRRVRQAQAQEVAEWRWARLGA